MKSLPVRIALTAANILRGVFIGLLLAYACYVVILQDAGAIIIRYAGY
jgi:hypothetical protein